MSEKNRFVKNSFFAYLTKFVPLLFSFIYTVILANSLGQAGYGLFMYLIALVLGFSKLFGSNLLNEIIMNFTAQTDSKKLFRRLFSLQYLLAIIIFSGLILFANEFITTIEGSDFGIFLMVLLILFLNPLSTSFFALNRGLRKFKNIFVAVLFENFIIMAGVILFVSFLGMGLQGAFYAKYLSLIFSGLIYIFYFRKTKFSNKPINKKAITSYGVFGALGEFLKQALSQAELIIMGIFISPVALGTYYIAEKISMIVLNSPATAISDVLFPVNSSNYKNKKKIEKYSSMCIKGTIIIVVILSVALLLLAHPVLTIFFPTYIAAAGLIPFIILREYMKTLGPINSILNSINKINQRTTERIITVTIGIVLLLLLVPAFGVIGLIIAQTINSFIAYTIAYFILRKYNNIKLDLIPKKKDIIFFYKEGKKIILTITKNIIRKKK